MQTANTLKETWKGGKFMVHSKDYLGMVCRHRGNFDLLTCTPLRQNTLYNRGDNLTHTGFHQGVA